jgi:hypothetical protein
MTQFILLLIDRYPNQALTKIVGKTTKNSTNASLLGIVNGAIADLITTAMPRESPKTLRIV